MFPAGGGLPSYVSPIRGLARFSDRARCRVCYAKSSTTPRSYSSCSSNKKRNALVGSCASKTCKGQGRPARHKKKT